MKTASLMAYRLRANPNSLVSRLNSLAGKKCLGAAHSISCVNCRVGIGLCEEGGMCFGSGRYDYGVSRIGGVVDVKLPVSTLRRLKPASGGAG